MSDIKTGDFVMIPALESPPEGNAEVNIYHVAGIDWLGRMWLSLRCYRVGGTELDSGTVWYSGAHYDGYNGDITMSKSTTHLGD